MKLHSCLGFAVFVISAGSVSGNLVNDSFNDFDRIGGFDGSSTSSTEPTINAPTATNTQWVVNGTSQMVASSTGLAWNMNNTSNRMAIGYFPEFTVSSTPITMTLTFTTGAFGASANNLRMALVNATPGGLRTTDGFGSSDASYVGDVGYGILSSGSNIGGGETGIDLGLTLRERVNTTSNNLLGSSGDWSSSLASSAGTGILDQNTEYTLSITLVENAGELAITVDMIGGNLSGMEFTGLDSTDPVLNFNAFAMRWGGGELQFSDFNLTSLTVSEVPEPSVYGLFLGMCVLGFVGWRRSRRR